MRHGGVTHKCESGMRMSAGAAQLLHSTATAANGTHQSRQLHSAALKLCTWQALVSCMQLLRKVVSTQSGTSARAICRAWAGRGRGVPKTHRARLQPPPSRPPSRCPNTSLYCAALPYCSHHSGHAFHALRAHGGLRHRCAIHRRCGRVPRRQRQQQLRAGSVGAGQCIETARVTGGNPCASESAAQPFSTQPPAASPRTSAATEELCSTKPRIWCGCSASRAKPLLLAAPPSTASAMASVSAAARLPRSASMSRCCVAGTSGELAAWDRRD